MYLFRERLKDLREELNLDQKEMGKRLNLSTSAYGYYEQGRNEPSLETLVKIAKTFSVSTDYLLGITNTPDNKVYYVSNDISLSESEVRVVRQLKENKLLDEIAESPVKNSIRLKRHWEFLKNEYGE